MVTIYTDKNTVRLQYVLDFIFGQREFEYSVITELEDFQKTRKNKLAYTTEDVKNNVRPSALLFSEEIVPVDFKKSELDGIECYAFDGVADPLASIFFVLSRYEEYIDDRRDEHGRYAAEYCSQKQYGWLDMAMCDRWAEQIIKLADVDPDYIHEIAIMPTFDIDNTYAYKLKKGTQRALSYIRDVAKNDKKRLEERKEVERGGLDPYDTFADIEQIAAAFSNTKVFWLVGDRAEFDRNIPISVRDHQDLIRHMAQRTIVGLHPSYASGTDLPKVKIEKERLEAVVGKVIESSRQHFLKIDLPKTYQNLVQIGFKDEYSMGFADAVGFRAGTARPFSWFDLSENEVTTLTVHPFVYMDGTLNEYNQLSPDEAKALIKRLYDEVKEYGGDFVFIWHNETIGEYGKWKGWRPVLEYSLNLKDES